MQGRRTLFLQLSLLYSYCCNSHCDNSLFSHCCDFHLFDSCCCSSFCHNSTYRYHKFIIKISTSNRDKDDWRWDTLTSCNFVPHVATTLPYVATPIVATLIVATIDVGTLICSHRCCKSHLQPLMLQISFATTDVASLIRTIDATTLVGTTDATTSLPQLLLL